MSGPPETRGPRRAVNSTRPWISEQTPRTIPLPPLTGNRCLCRACGNYFSTVRNFDSHRRGGECRHPADVGLVLNPAGVWTRPGNGTVHSALRQSGRLRPTADHWQVVAL